MTDEWKDQEVIEGHAMAISAEDDQTVKDYYCCMTVTRRRISIKVHQRILYFSFL